jgi:predicted CoA-binding protein
MYLAHIMNSFICAAMVYYSRTTSNYLAMQFTNPGPDEINRLLREVHSVAVLGLSPNTDRPSFRVAQGLQSHGYRIIPVRPMVAEVLGEKAYPDLESLPELPDIVDVFRASEHVPAIVDSCIRLGIRKLWLQEGVVNEAAALRAREAGITVVMDLCIWRELVRTGAHPS